MADKYKVNRHDFVPGKGAEAREVVEKNNPLTEKYRRLKDEDEIVWRPMDGKFVGYTIFDISDDGLIEIGLIQDGVYKHEKVTVEQLHVWQLAAQAKQEKEKGDAKWAPIKAELKKEESLVEVYREKIKTDEPVLVQRGSEYLPYKVVGVKEKDSRWVVDLLGTLDGKPDYINGIEVNQLNQWQKIIDKKRGGEKTEPEVVESMAGSVDVSEPLTGYMDEPEVAATKAKLKPEPAVVLAGEKKLAGERKKIKIDVAAADISEEIENRAKDVAEETLSRNKEELKGVSGWFAKVWKHNIAAEIYRQIEIRRAKELIVKDENLYAADKAGKEAHERATKAVVERFLSEYEREMIHKEAGEEKRVLGNEGVSGEIKKKLESLVKSYAAENSMTRADLDEAAKRIFREAGELDYKTKAAGDMYATNIFEMAEAVRTQAAHAGGLENLDIELSLTIGKAKLGARTEREATAVDSVLEKMRKYSFGATDLFANELSVAVASFYAIGAFAARRVATSTTASMLSFGGASLAAGIMSGVSEHGRLKRERALHERQRAVGMDYDRGAMTKAEADAKRSELQTKRDSLSWYQFGEKKRIDQEMADLENAPRREEMEKFSHDKYSATQAAKDLNALVVSEEGRIALRENNEEGFRQALLLLALNEARIRASDRRKVDLLSYSSVDSVEGERLQLDIARARLKAALREKFASGGAGDFADGKSFDELVAFHGSLYEEGTIKSGVEVKDSAFNKMRTKKAVMRGVYTAAIGATVGAAIGSVIQEGWAAGSENKFGIVDFLRDKFPAMHETMTPMARLATWMSGEMSHVEAGPIVSHSIGNGEFKLPEGVNMVRETDGTFSLVFGTDHQQLIGGLEVGPDGQFTQESINHLEDANIATFVDVRSVSTEIVTEGSLSKSEWMAEHPDLVTWVKRDVWYGNDTPMYFDESIQKWLGADHNELKLEWGDSGDDNIVMTMSRMEPDGSWHRLDKVDAQQMLAEGKIRLLLSMSEGTQNRPVEVFANGNGDFEIPKDGDVARAFFEIRDGKVIPHYRFAEVAVDRGMDSDGRVHFGILATHPSDGLKEVPTWIKEDATRDIPVTVFDFPVERPVELPPIIPVRSRTPLERMKAGKGEPALPLENSGPAEVDAAAIAPYFGGSVESAGGGSTEKGAFLKELIEVKDDGRELPEKIAYYKLAANKEMLGIMLGRNRSETLKEDPRARLDQYKETNSYFEKLPADYLAEVKELAEQAGPMGKEVRVGLDIPVAGHQEEASIYRSLENYLYQTADKKKFEINLFVNYPETDKLGNPLNAEGTLKEIERFKKDHPELTVNVMVKKLPTEEARISLIRKLLNDAVLMRNLERGEGAPELLLVSNDADNTGIAPEYVENFIARFDADPSVDSMLGQLDWDPEAYVKYPAVHVGTRLFQYKMIGTRQQSGFMASSGANFALRAGTYAAVGGYRPEIADGGEDVILGRAILVARQTPNVQKFAGARVSRVYTSARRAIDALTKKGLAPIEQWSRGFSAFDDAVRKLSMEGAENRDYDDPSDVAKLKDELEYVINRTVNALYKYKGKIAPEVNANYEKLLGYMGIKVRTVENGSLVVSDITKFVEDLKGYQKYGVAQRDAKSGKPGAREAFLEQRAQIVTEREEARVKTMLEVADIVEALPKAPKLQVENDPIAKELVDGSLEKTTIADKYVAAGDMVLSESLDKAKVVAGYEIATGAPVVVKETTPEQQERARQRHGDVDVEQLLVDQGFEHPSVLLPKERVVEANGNVARVYDAGAVDLETYLNEHSRVPEGVAVDLVMRVADGLDALHRAGVVHADVAPLNILMTKESVKIIDVEDAVPMNGKWGAESSGFLGNRFVSPPEMFKDKPAFDQRVDVYQLGATLYRMVVGKWPYIIKGESKLSPEERKAQYASLHEAGDIQFPDRVSEDLRKVIKKAMSPERNGRYASMDEFVLELSRVDVK